MLNDDRDAASLKIKRNLIQFHKIVNVGMIMLENRSVERIAAMTFLDRFIERVGDTRFVQAVEEREQKHPFAGRAKGIEMLFQRHLSTRQRAGLVTAQNVDAAEVLHGFKMFDDHVLASHVHGSAAE